MINESLLTNIMFTLLTIVMPITMRSAYREMLETISKYNKYIPKSFGNKVKNIGIFLIAFVILLWISFLLGLNISYHIPFVSYLFGQAYFAGVNLLIYNVVIEHQECEKEPKEEDSINSENFEKNS